MLDVQVPARDCPTQLEEVAEVSLPVQARCSGTAIPYRQPPGSLLLPPPALLPGGDPGRGLSPVLESCCIWQCTPTEEKLGSVSGFSWTSPTHESDAFLAVLIKPTLEMHSQGIPHLLVLNAAD